MSDPQSLIDMIHPYAMGEIEKAKDKDTRLAHYTTAEAARNILQTEEIWMRKTSCMDDYTEVEHGCTHLNDVLNGSVGTEFKNILNRMFPGITSRIEELLNEGFTDFYNNTYIACLSEHSHDDDEHDDKYGRLSMWRAYGGSAGVALVLNTAPFFAETRLPGLFFSPVAYLDRDKFVKQLRTVMDRISCNKTYLRNLGQEAVMASVKNAFVFAALCTKHRGFYEEREWRVIYSPALEKSCYVQESIELVRGTPQLIYKIPLKNIPDIGLSGIEVPELLNRIIIGPTKYPATMYECFTMILSKLGVEDPEARVHVSDIPLRM